MLFWIIIGIVAVLVVVFLVAFLICRSLPPDHVVTATLAVKQSPEKVWSLLADVANQPNWDKGTTKVEMLPPRDGKECLRMHMGRNSFVLLTTRSEPGRLLEREIIDDAKFFSGRWECIFSPTPDGSTLKLTEYGKVYPSIPRFMMKYVVDPAMYLKRHLNAIAKHFGEEPRLTDVKRVS